MKIKNNIGLLLTVLLLGMNSCYDSKMEWGDPNTHPAAKDLPLPLQEAISRYEALKAYAPAGLKLGVGIGFDMYQSNETYRNVVNDNFNDITPGNEMKQASIMNAKGELNFANVDKVVDQLTNAGLSVYGHTLVWHSQQQAAYLNGLIAPTIIPGTPGSSLIDGSFENGLAGWAPAYYTENYSIINTDAIDGTHSIQAIIPADATGGKYDGHGQLNSPDFPIINGHHYQISFWIKGSAVGQVAIDFPNAQLGNQYPWVNGAEYAPVGTTWTQVIYNNSTVGNDAMIATADNDAMHVRLLLASVPNVTYLIDAVEIVDLDAVTEEVNYVENGNFESGDIDPWATPNQGAGITVTADAKYAGNYGLQAISSSTSQNDWDLQFQSGTMNLDVNKTYTFSFWVKSDIAGKGRISYNGKINDGSASGNQYPWMDWDGTGAARDFATSSTWKLISVDIIPFSSTLQLSFDFGQVPDVTYYFDDVKVVEKAPAKSTMRSGPVTIEKTPEEKAQIIGDALVDWINQMVGHFKGVVHAWDAVNEPMNESGNGVKTGVGTTLAADNFYWQDYLGKDYAVTAFKTARAADPAAKLFINDYNLESNPSKLQGLIDYVTYIESQGATVDGIGTQMHITIQADTTMIDNMFKKLGETGKLIKISEMDIAIQSASPTDDQYAAQANMYRFVVSSFLKNIPEAKRYGITVWAVSDNPDEHTYWIPNDAPCLFDADYGRKYAYKGFADGLAGKDVSADFSGELVY